jgi:hypothetical protein
MPQRHCDLNEEYQGQPTVALIDEASLEMEKARRAGGARRAGRHQRIVLIFLKEVRGGTKKKN